MGQVLILAQEARTLAAVVSIRLAGSIESLGGAADSTGTSVGAAGDDASTASTDLADMGSSADDASGSMDSLGSSSTSAIGIFGGLASSIFGVSSQLVGLEMAHLRVETTQNRLEKLDQQMTAEKAKLNAALANEQSYTDKLAAAQAKLAADTQKYNDILAKHTELHRTHRGRKRPQGG